MKKRWKIFLIVVVLILVLMVAVKTLSNEDDWICVDGKWVKHGYPVAEKPAEPCEENLIQRIFNG
ncbi:MAG: hypothetical protein ABIH92_03990 [Nanoarchaeota archaeon]